MKEARTYDGLEIAVIGMSGQFPSSNDCGVFWEKLMQEKELTTTYTADEIRASGVADEAIADARYVRSAAVVTGKEYFDHKFFGYRPDEAALMDPQIRLFHMHCWKALEDAGYAASTGKQRIGLFGASAENGNWQNYAWGKAREMGVDPFYVSCIANGKFISALIAYKLNLKGPVVYLDSACSSSLVAIHTACKSLLTRECNIALTGGVRLASWPEKGYSYQEGMILSPDGHCRTFDRGANGTYGGEGVGVVVLKRLNEAIRDGDHIYAMVKSSAINNDGNNKVGFTAPSVQGQSECIRMAHRIGGVDPKSIGYVEAHGTATKLGDPIEIKALQMAFSLDGKEKTCAIGSVKSNMGHLDTAAGVAGFIKAVLCLHHKKIPASLHYTAPNPEIDFDEGPFYVNTSSRDWKPRGDLPLRAGVSSFGIGGTNAHVVLEEAPELKPDKEERKHKLLLLSALSENSLKRYTEDLRRYILNHPGLDLADMAYTSQVGRKHFSKKRPIVFKDREDLLQQLEQPGARIQTSPEREINMAFMFPGQGSQYPDMGRDLYDNEPYFQQQMDKGFTILRQLTGRDYKEIIFPSKPGEEAINGTIHAQPLIFLLEYAVAKLLMHWGVKPQHIIGHSIGEYVAACICGVFSFEDALQLVVKRAELMDSLPEGSMAVVLIPEAESVNYCNAEISLAAVNAPGQVVLSGPTPQINELIVQLKREGITAMKSNTSHAFHSSMLDPILGEFSRVLENVSFAAGTTGECTYVSNRTGTFITQEESGSPEYWVRHLRETVRFSAGIKTLLSHDKDTLFVEAGAGRGLTALLKQHMDPGAGPNALNIVRHQNEKDSDSKYLMEKLGQLWVLGAEIDWLAFNEGRGNRRVSYPTYSFEPVVYPAEVKSHRQPAAAAASGNQKGSLKDWVYHPGWKTALPLSSDHREEKRCWLYFSTNDRFSAGLRQQLVRDQDSIIEINIGDERQAKFEDLKRQELVVTDVLYSWGMQADPAKPEVTGDNTELYPAYFGIVEVVRALFRNNISVSNGLTILTGSLYKVTGDEQGPELQALAVGLLNVIPQEYPIRCRHIDIAVGGDPGNIDAALLRELRYGDGKERVVAIRNGRRWVVDYSKDPGDVVAPAVNKKLKREGVYLITGGLGNVGFLLAKHLASRYQAKLVLTGRRDIQGAENEPARRLRELQASSRDVVYRRVDVADEAALMKLAGDIKDQYGPINGIIHTAGNTSRDDFELIDDITPQGSSSVFLPKVAGIRNLYHVFKAEHLDFVWITSSIASIVGGSGFGAYAAANAFMEHFVSLHSRELPGWKCISLAEIMPMATGAAGEEAAKKKYLSGDAIISLFEWSLEKEVPVIVESVRELTARLEEITVKEMDIGPSGGETVEKSERPKLSNAYVAPLSAIEKTLIEMMENFFGIAGLGVNDNFFDLGGDSLMAMSYLTRVKNAFDVTITIKFFFSNPTVMAVSLKISEMKMLKDVKKHSSKKII